jgi:replicative DNA helicase
MNQEHFDSEASLLGSLLLDNSLLAFMPFLHAEHFAEPLHQRIFAAIEEARNAGAVATPITLKERFDADPALADIGGGKYLFKLCSHTLSSVSPVDEAKHLTALAERRAVLQALDDATAKLKSPELKGTSADIVLSLISQMEDISRGFDGPVIEDDIAISDRILKNMYNQQAAVSTGIRKLDEAMGGGLYDGKAYGFAAKKKHGKTILAGTISSNLNQAGIKHLFICGEMSPEEVQQRTLARLTDSYPSNFRSDKGASPLFRQKIADAAARSKGCILYHHSPGITFDQLRRVVLSAILQKRIKGFILDYWQLVKGHGKGNITEHYDNVAQWIADTCRKYGVWSITMAQINQEGNTRGGEGIRLAFDQVYQIHRPDLGQPQTWLEMMDTRYTKWMNIGDEMLPGLLLNEKGPFFEEAA